MAGSLTPWTGTWQGLEREAGGASGRRAEASREGHQHGARLAEVRRGMGLPRAERTGPRPSCRTRRRPHS